MGQSDYGERTSLIVVLLPVLWCRTIITFRVHIWCFELLGKDSNCIYQCSQSNAISKYGLNFHQAKPNNFPP